eukprot:13639733-Heterocapsa_arctica.AAC.1
MAGSVEGGSRPCKHDLKIPTAVALGVPALARLGVGFADRASSSADFPADAPEKELDDMVGCNEILTDPDCRPFLPVSRPPFPSP